MILQAVPTEDPDQQDGEDDALMAYRTPRTLVISEEDRSWRLAALVICCCLSWVGVGASLAVLSRYATESEVTGQNSKKSELPLIVVFSNEGAPDATVPTNNGLAWLMNSMLKGRLVRTVPEQGSRFVPGVPPPGPFIPGEAADSWLPPTTTNKDKAHPDKKTGPNNLRVLVRGQVATILRQQYGFKPPQVRDMDQLWQSVPEADAFLQIRNHLKDVSGPGRPSPNTPTAQKLILVSHPHRLPYLVLLARAAGFVVAVLDPVLYSVVPWSTFGCGPLGYASAADPHSAVHREDNRFRVYVDQLRSSDPDQLKVLEPLLRAANATLRFYKCTTHNQDVSPTTASRQCMEPEHR